MLNMKQKCPPNFICMPYIWWAICEGCMFIFIPHIKWLVLTMWSEAQYTSFRNYCKYSLNCPHSVLANRLYTGAHVPKHNLLQYLLDMLLPYMCQNQIWLKIAHKFHIYKISQMYIWGMCVHHICTFEVTDINMLPENCTQMKIIPRTLMTKCDCIGWVGLWAK